MGYHWRWPDHRMGLPHWPVTCEIMDRFAALYGLCVLLVPLNGTERRRNPHVANGRGGAGSVLRTGAYGPSAASGTAAAGRERSGFYRVALECGAPARLRLRPRRCAASHAPAHAGRGGRNRRQGDAAAAGRLAAGARLLAVRRTVRALGLFRRTAPARAVLRGRCPPLPARAVQSAVSPHNDGRKALRMACRTAAP